ncbi:General transcription factor IIH subunit 1 [Halotydeus destructor]|nr:General transcription factor IIH subunit 1 [Halotydeus destructor]
MTTSSEDVLTSVGQVRHKKTDGTLYIMPERVGWMPNGKDSITVSIKYSDIKMQKISPEGKPKVQLQLVLHSNEAPTFHFVNAKGSSGQLKDRNVVKELLQQLLPKFKNRLSRDIEEKNDILSKNPELFQLYKDLVTSAVISSEEFWTQLVPSHLAANSGSYKASKSSISGVSNNGQTVGISPAFLSGIKPTTDGTNGIKYNINNDIIEAVFRTYPAVKRKHYENVPHKLSESEFWTKFFQSHYFHRDRVFAGSNKGDFFAECARFDEQNIRQAASQQVEDPFVDLTAFDDVEYVNKVMSDKDNEEKEPSNQSKSGKDKSRDRWETLSNITNPNQALIKRFNYHSIMVLDACLASKLGSTEALMQEPDITEPKKSVPKPVNDPVEEEKNSEVSAKKRKLLVEGKTQLDDLANAGDANSWLIAGSRPLRIRDKNLYLAGPSGSSQSGDGVSGMQRSTNFLASCCSNQNERLSAWQPTLNGCLTSSAALGALSDLSPGGSLLKSTHTASLNESVPLDVQKELRNTYLAGNELLKQFWSNFPVTGEKQEAKLMQLKVILQKFQYSKLGPLQQKISKQHYNTELTGHLNHQLECCFNKFQAWQTKKGLLSRK